MNAELFDVLAAHADWFTNRFAETRPEHYLFPWGKPTPRDPTKPITDITGAWDALRKRAAVRCCLHDLRHTAITKMAEAGVAESTMLAIVGHMSRAMLERYSTFGWRPSVKPSKPSAPRKAPTKWPKKYPKNQKQSPQKSPQSEKGLKFTSRKLLKRW